MGNYWIDLEKEEKNHQNRLDELKLQKLQVMRNTLVPSPKPKDRWDVSFFGNENQITVGEITVLHSREHRCGQIRSTAKISGKWTNTLHSAGNRKAAIEELLLEFGANQAILWKYTQNTLSHIWVLNDLVGFAYGDHADDFDFWFKFNHITIRTISDGQGQLTSCPNVSPKWADTKA